MKPVTYDAARTSATVRTSATTRTSGALRRLAVTAAASAAALAAAAPAYACPPPAAGDRLTVTVADSGGDGDGTYELECGPGGAGGTHPSPGVACERLGVLAAEGEDPFAPVGKDAMCTQIYGGPAIAHVTGVWQGRPVDARFKRTNGCEIARWQNLVPVLPSTGS